MSLVFPLFLISQLISAGGIGTGIAASVAGALGAGERERADRCAAQALWLALAFGLVIGDAMLFAGPSLYAALGAQGVTLAAAREYSTVVFGGIVLVWLMNLLANAVRGTGAMAVSASAIVGGEAVHLALSPTLILGLGPFPRLGVTGAGLAVLASYGTGAAILLAYLLSRRAGARLRAGALMPNLHELRAILKVGIPASVTMIFWQGTAIAGTMLVARLGPAALAGYGVAQRLEIVQAPLSFALGSAAVSMVAINLGAGQPERARSIARAAAIISGVIGADFALIALLLPQFWMHLFTNDPNVIADGVLYLRCIGASLALAGIGYGIAFSLMGAGQASLPALASLCRVLVLAGLGWLVLDGLGFGLGALFTVAAASNIAFAAPLLIRGTGAIGR